MIRNILLAALCLIPVEGKGGNLFELRQGREAIQVNMDPPSEDGKLGPMVLIIQNAGTTSYIRGHLGQVFGCIRFQLAFEPTKDHDENVGNIWLRFRGADQVLLLELETVYGKMSIRLTHKQALEMSDKAFRYIDSRLAQIEKAGAAPEN